MSWKKVKLSEVAVVDWGNTSLTKEAYTETGEYLGVSAAGPDGKMSHYEHEPGVTVISAIGANCGKVFYLNTKFTAIKNTMTVTPNKSRIHPKYLYWFLTTSPFKSRGAGQPFLAKGDTVQIQIPFPPLATQQRIADTLDAADALRRKDQELLGKYDELAHSLFDGIFGDPVRNEKGWDAYKLGDVSSVQIGPFGSLLHVHDYVQGGIPLVNPTHINNGLIKEDDDYTVSPTKHASLRNYHLETGDVIMGRRGEMGRCALVTERENGWLCGTGSLVVRPFKSMDSSLLVKILSHPSTKLELEKSSMGTTMMNLNQKIVSNLKVIMPPVSEQARFEQALKSLNRQREQVKLNIQESYTLFKSLLHSYFA